MRRKFFLLELIKIILACVLAVLMLILVHEIHEFEYEQEIIINNPPTEQQNPSFNFVISIPESQEITISSDAAPIPEEKRLGEMELVAQMVQAEAGNQDLKGKRLVADVIYNRRDDNWAKDVEGVIFQRLNGVPQFSSVDDGNFRRAGWNVSEESFLAARLEYDPVYRLDNDVLYFCAGHYNPSGTPGYKYQDHYFSYK